MGVFDIVNTLKRIEVINKDWGLEVRKLINDSVRFPEFSTGLNGVLELQDEEDFLIIQNSDNEWRRVTRPGEGHVIGDNYRIKSGVYLDHACYRLEAINFLEKLSVKREREVPPL